MTDLVLSTAVHRVFAGLERKFELRLGEIKELEQVCGAGIGEIYVRVCTLRFKVEDLRQTLRLGLVGGGLPAAEAMALVMLAVDGRELNPMHALAIDVLRALFEGIDSAGNFAGPRPTGSSDDAPATSAPSTSTAPPPGFTPDRSIN